MFSKRIRSKVGGGHEGVHGPFCFLYLLPGLLPSFFLGDQEATKAVYLLWKVSPDADRRGAAAAILFF